MCYANCGKHSHDASIRVFDESGALIETHESNGVFREPLRIHCHKRLDCAPMRLRSSGMLEIGKWPAKSPRARRRTRGGSPESSRWPDCLDLCPGALLARYNGAQRAGCDTGHCFLLLIGW